MTHIKFVLTNLIAKDWRKLAQFYIDVFDCQPVLPERDLSGDWLDRLTKIPSVKIKGIHLKLPGYDEGPTLEIFEYNNTTLDNRIPLISDRGFTHIAFHVDDLGEVVQKLLDHGGKIYGERVEKSIPGVGLLEVIYTTDPEGNIVEIQKWKKEK